MSDQRTDRIAREAARLLETGRADSVASAIRAAADALDAADAPLPGHGTVRKHIQGMAMQAMGDVAYRASVRGILSIAEQTMSLLEHALPDAQCLLMGRAAKGLVDGPVTLHIRVHTRRPMREIVEAVIEYGHDEPAFETGETRLGRLDRIRFAEEDCEIVITRCPPEMVRERSRDLFTGRVIASATVEELRRHINV
jgi:hypothetical protein